MRAKKSLCSCAALFLTVALLHAQVIPGRWEKVDALAAGIHIVVKMNTGDRVEGNFRSTDFDSVLLTALDGREIRLPKSGVRSIETTVKVRDSLRNGAWIGAGVGSLGGMLATVTYAKSVTASGSIWGEDTAGYLIGSALVGAGVGALAGVAVDASIKSNEVIYRAR
jgi:hypothetical protein